MSVLVLAEHDNASLKAPTLNTVAAAAKIGGDIHVLVAGENCGPAAEAAAKVAGVAKVIQVEGAQYAHGLAEALAPLVAGLAKGYAAVLAPETTTGKNVMPRVAALLDVMQIRSEEHTSELQSLMRISYAVFCLQKKKNKKLQTHNISTELTHIRDLT